MSPDCMLTVDELDELEDISGVALYRAEVRNIPLLTEDQEMQAVDAARMGDTEACDLLVHQCLRFTMSKAGIIYRDFRPAHTDVMDLVGQAHLKMMEALPNALHSTDPVRYLMSVAALEMKRACIYDDPMIPRKRGVTYTRTHPTTVGMDMDLMPLEKPPAAPANLISDVLLHDAVMSLSEKKRLVLVAVYGLFGASRKPRQEIADELEMYKVTVDKYVHAAKRKLAEKLGPYVLNRLLGG